MAMGTAVPADRYRALVVEDQPQLCRGVIRALTKEGFDCSGASNGAEALAYLRHNACDVVVTDLAMPVVNGHTLSVEILKKEPRPIVVVLTGINEPRIAKDLIKRGVDDIVFKPVEFAVLSAKVLALVEKARRSTVAATATATATATEDPTSSAARLPEDYQERIDRITALPPLSPAVFDIFRMAQSDQGDAEQLAANLARDASLAVEVLRLANSAFYNPCGESITELRMAVARIGRRRICALALSRHLLTTTQSSDAELISSKLAWRQSVGAGVAIELLIDAGGYRCVCEELFLCALMHSLGRLVQVSTFPEIYQALFARCLQSRSCLHDEENRVFPQSHTGMLASLLKQWGIAPAVYEPLNGVERTYERVAKMPEPLRTQVELLKIAALIGRIAAGTWEDWEQLELPPAESLKRLGLQAADLQQIINKTVVDTDKICSYRNAGDEHSSRPLPAGRAELQKFIEYFVPESTYFDWLAPILPALGVRANALHNWLPSTSDKHVVANFTASTDRDISAHQNEVRSSDVMLVPQSKASLVTAAGQLLTFPCSFAKLKQSLFNAAWGSETSDVQIPLAGPLVLGAPA